MKHRINSVENKERIDIPYIMKAYQSTANNTPRLLNSQANP